MALKKEYLALLAVIILLTIYLALRPVRDSLETLPQPATVESARIDRLIITHETPDGVALVKQEDRWLIEPQGHPADITLVRNMLRTISDLTLTALVSESGNLERYGLAENERITLRAFVNDAQVRAFDIGVAAPTHQHTFVRLDGDSRVYHARGLIKPTFEQTADSLRDRTVFDFDRSEVTTIRLAQGGRATTLTRQPQAAAPEPEKERAHSDAADFVWRDENGREVDSDAVKRLLNGMARMDCDGFMDDRAAERLARPRWEITFEGPGAAFTLTVFEKETDVDEHYPAMASTIPYAFVLNENRTENYDAAVGALVGSPDALSSPAETHRDS